MTTATQTQLRGDTNSNLMAATPASREIGIDTTNHRPHVGDGSRLGGWACPNFSDIQRQAFQAATVGGTGNDITLTNSVPIISYVQNLRLVFKATAANTTGVTVAVDGGAAKNVYKLKDGTLSALESGDLVSGGMYGITYDGTQFQIKGLDEGRGTLAGLTLIAIISGGGTTYDFTSGIDSTYQNYYFLIDSMLPATSSDNLSMRVRLSGGSWQTSLYRKLNAPGSNSTYFDIDDQGQNAASSLGKGLNGRVNAYNLATSDYASFDWNSINHNQAGSPYVKQTISGGYFQSNTAIDGIRFFYQTNNIASGKISMYGYKKAL